MAEALYYARYIRDDTSKMWRVEISQNSDVYTFGRTLDGAEENVRDALAASLNVQGKDIFLRHEYHCGRSADEAVMAARDARQRAKEAADQAALLTREAARKLTEELGLSLRDTARILGISHQRVSQVLTEEVLHSMAVETRARLFGGLQLPPQR